MKISSNTQQLRYPKNLDVALKGIERYVLGNRTLRIYLYIFHHNLLKYGL